MPTVWGVLALLISLLVQMSCSSEVATDSTPPEQISAELGSTIRGVTFFYLNGGAEDFPYVLNNLNDSTVRAKIAGVLTGYRNAGVNWIRLLIAADHFPQYSSWPNQTFTEVLLQRVKQFIEITRAGENAGRFKIELVLVSKRRHDVGYADFYYDPPPYVNDKAWFSQMLNGLASSDLGMVLIAGDLTPCGYSSAAGGYRCHHEPQVSAHDANHGQWVETMWPWIRSRWPNLPLSYEIIGGTHIDDYALLKKGAAWVTAYTPTVPVIAVSHYFAGAEDARAPGPAPGSPWSAWAKLTTGFLAAFHSVTTKPLWIDEFGLPMGIGAARIKYSNSDQSQAMTGFLAATQCQSNIKYPVFGWVGGNDSPYNGQTIFGFASGFLGSSPQWRPAWADVSRYYQGKNCPVYVNGFEQPTDVSSWKTWHTCAVDTQWSMVRFYASNPLAPGGQYVMRLHTSGFVPGCANPGLYAQSPAIPAQAGTTYYVDNLSRNAASTGELWLIFLNSSGSQLSASKVNLSPDAWQFNRDPLLIATAPPGTSSLRLRYALTTPHEYADFDQLVVRR